MNQKKPETMAKRNNVEKEEVKTQAAQSGPAVRVEYPKEGEALAGPCYTFRIGAIPEADNVEVSIDQGEWKPCREALGLWWYDWAGYSKGEHTLAARSRKGDGLSATSNLRRFTVA